jgi:hypothetical protein
MDIIRIEANYGRRLEAIVLRYAGNNEKIGKEYEKLRKRFNEAERKAMRKRVLQRQSRVA